MSFLTSSETHRCLPSRHPRWLLFLVGIAFAVGVGSVAAPAQTRPEWANVLVPMTPEDLAAIPPATGPSGRDLPPGSGTAKRGAEIVAQKCATCHGANLEGRPAPKPGAGDTGMGFQGGGSGSMVRGKDLPLWGINTFGIPTQNRSGISRAQFVAYATTLWNIIMVGMPGYHSGSLTPDEGYSLVAYILARNEIIPEDMVLNRETLPKVQMPRRNDYIPANVDDVLDIKKRGCYKTFAICEPIEVPEGSFNPPPYGEW